MSEPFPNVPGAEDRPGATPAPRPFPYAGLAVLFAGMALIALAALLEERALDGLPWRFAVYSPDGAALWDGAIPLRAREVPRANLRMSETATDVLERVRARPDGRELVETLGLEQMERVLMLPLGEDLAQSLISAGRAPVPGKPEVLAGALTRFDAFEMDGVTFTVVGRLHPSTSGMLFTYLLPESEAMAALFGDETGATRGWLDPEGLTRDIPAEFEELPEIEATLVGRGARAPDSAAWSAFAGLALVAVGGAWAQIRLLERLARGRHVLAPVAREFGARPALLWGMHLLLYGAFFLAMYGAFVRPLANLRVMQAIQSVFTEGPLTYVGDAYASGNILHATLATFNNNYIVQTCGFTLLPSLAIPFFGVVKNLLSFTLVGFGMAPLWVGSIGYYTFHCITLTLELEAYVIASFAVSVLPVRCAQGLFRGRFACEYVAGMRTIASAALLAGVLLAVAALYEAATLILLL